MDYLLRSLNILKAYPETRIAAFVAYIGSFLQSYSTCIIAGSLLFISEEFSLSPIDQGKVASSIILGALFGALISSYVADFFGRKPAILFTSLVFFLMAILSQFISTFFWFLSLRFTMGIAVGISSTVVPMYLAEIAPAKRRGGFVSGYELSITLGILAAYVMGYIGTLLEDWRVMYFFPVFPALIQLLLYKFLPESLSWHSLEKRTTLFTRKLSLLLLIGFVLSAFQQLSGFNAVVCFAPKIFLEAGFSERESATFVSIFIGCMHVIVTLISLFIIDRIGRRKLLLFSQGGILVTLGLTILSFSQNLLTLSVGSILAFVFFYSIGIGPVVWVLIAEIFPLSVRAKAVSFLTFTSWFCSYFIILFFPQLLSAYGAAITLTIPAVFSFVAFVFYMYFIPETNGKSLEELEMELSTGNRIDF